MKEYSESEIRSVYEELKKLEKEHFIRREDLFKVIKEFYSILHKEIGYIKEQFLNLERTMLEIKRELDSRIDRIEEKLAELERGETIEFKVLPRKEAVKLIEDYIEKHPGCLTSEIIEALQLDPSLVVDILRELEEKGEVESREPE